MQLARMGSISTPDDFRYDPSDEARKIAAEKDRRRKATLDLALDKQQQAQNEIDLARTGLTQKEFERTTNEDAQRRDVLRGYQQDSVARDTIPLGVVNPRLVDEQEGMGPMQAPSMRSGKLEQSTLMDLANINPDIADSFRKTRQGEIHGAEDRSRGISLKDAEERRKEAEIGIKDRALTEEERDNAARRNLDWFNARTARTKAEAPTTFKPTPGQAAVDREFAKDIVAWSMGGASAVQKDLKQLEDVLQEIAPVDEKTGKRRGKSNISGPFIGMVPDRLKPAVGLGKSLDVQERVQEVAQKNLREILGGQFAMKEGEQLIARAYNPRLSPEVNAQRIERLLPQMKAAAAAKEEAAQYFLKNGSLAGYDLTRLQMGMDGLKGAIEGLDKQPQGTGNVRDGGDEYEEYLRLKEQAGQ